MLPKKTKTDFMEMNRNTEFNSDESPENVFELSFPKGEESFPVLKAFQEFLDAERERSRRRQMILTLSFMSVIVVIVVLFCVIGAILFTGMARRNDAKQDKVFEILLMERKTSTPVPVVTPAPPRQDPVVDEVMELVKQLRAETAALKAELQRAAEPPPVVEMVAPVSVSEELALEPAEVKPEPAPKRTGVFSSPKRKSDLPPTDVDVDAVTAEMLPESSEVLEGAEPEKKTELANSEASGDGLVQVKIIPSRVMHPPEGYAADEISIVTEGNVRYPWRVLVPAVISDQIGD